MPNIQQPQGIPTRNKHRTALGLSLKTIAEPHLRYNTKQERGTAIKMNKIPEKETV